MSRKEESIAKAIEILSQYPDGLRYTDLIEKTSKALPEFPKNTVHGSLWEMDKSHPDQVYKPARGLWLHAKYKDSLDRVPEIPKEKTTTGIKEEGFYQPFADWLVNDLEDCTKAISLGGSIFKGKWGTPDVIGVRDSSRSDIIKGQTEIVTAEIKLDKGNLIEAFGQVCSYKLFSHKCYLVVPKNSTKDDIDRLDSLCLIFGIGLVLFNSEDKSKPDFSIKTRPIKHEPDMFYVNKNLQLIEKELFSS